MKQNLEFLDNIDPYFFMYEAKSNLKLYNYKKYRQHAALAIRIAFSHGLETLFSLLGATIQAPYCINAWMLHCNNKQLHNVIARINNHMSLPTMLKVNPPDWQTVSEAVHLNLILNDKQKEKSIKRSFGTCGNNGHPILLVRVSRMSTTA